jgi:hypothetical protein
MSIGRSLLFAGLLGLSAYPLAAQAGRPSAAELHDKAVQAVGGKAAIQKQTARRLWGRFEVPAQGMTGPIEIFSAAPARLLIKTEIPGFGSSTSGFDGETGWAINPAMGPMVLDGTALNQLRQQADFHAELHPEKYVASRETTGEAEYEGKSCWTVTVKTTWGESYTECYDKSSGLLLASIRKQSTPMGELETTTILSDYKEFDGLKMATLIRASTMGIQQVVHVDSVSTKPIPDSVFVLPPAVKALKKS